jgi:hypothetical protein
MARNPNNEHDNRHCLILGTSGSGKTRWLTKNADIKNCRRVVLWDPEADHWAIHCKTRAEFVRTLTAALQSGKQFRVAYEAAHVTPAEFDWWCAVVWAMLDGRFETVAIVEEVADVVKAGSAPTHWGFLTRKGRKYGLRLFVVSQRPQLVDKTTVGQCPFKWAGALETDLDRRAVGAVLSLTAAQLAEAGQKNQPGKGKPRWYWWKEPGAKPAELRSYSTR